ncbi:hypothetical protein KL942_001725 [Ogataea angusta]|uniref:Anaphase-promoting complex subunit 11 RING-H2 finger domain-containing protein n=1 Tax=Pichia angusta TaxID=870730 RepID=A0AAN6DJL9_PICAN|nr:uncharacterized protein KL928_001522 [Ogataea angusta]KAG7820085.1 hypothetical protein KL928_001522 [Ogataea angusta]KAG7823767.1 hypothetical protein KL909_002504 [Ogataea angusta]KAG7829457.1 hypothetical protein KL920_002316 [Ogataea angusta]KAG7838320.1 hypothetical protein KL943_000396 [Ogataea angusta]KAG7840737.1 hypothetical protein KL942_001725 [Ogataea angusta]
MHCIWKWLETETAKGLCPMCRQPFTMDKDKDVNKGVSLPETSRFAAASNEGFLADMLEPQPTDAMSVQDLSGGD